MKLRNYEGIRNKNGYVEIDISRIQETHNTANDIIELAKYNIYFSKDIGNNGNINGIGGVSIMVRKYN